MGIVPQQFVCDVCGAKKGENNHWFVARAGLMLDGKTIFELFPWLRCVYLTDKESVHVCGQHCAHKMMDWWFQTGKLEKPSTASGDQAENRERVGNVLA